MISVRTRSAITLLLFALSPLIVNQSIAANYQCETPSIFILGGDPQSASLACEGARRATAFLRAQGLDVSSRIDVELVAKLSNKSAAGHLLPSSKNALVLNYSEFLKFGDWLRVPINAEIYRALVAHEVAHVVAAHNFQITKPVVQAHEYIAYVTTFATMNPIQRERVLRQFSGDGFETELQMNTTIYLCDPMRFGAEAYRHFVKKGKDAGFFGSILSGDVLTE